MLHTKKCILFFFINLVKILSELNIFFRSIIFNNPFKACFSSNSNMHNTNWKKIDIETQLKADF